MSGLSSGTPGLAPVAGGPRASRRSRIQIVLGCIGLALLAIGAFLATATARKEWTPPLELSVIQGRAGQPVADIKFRFGGTHCCPTRGGRGRPSSVVVSAVAKRHRTECRPSSQPPRSQFTRAPSVEWAYPTPGRRLSPGDAREHGLIHKSIAWQFGGGLYMRLVRWFMSQIVRAWGHVVQTAFGLCPTKRAATHETAPLPTSLHRTSTRQVITTISGSVTTRVSP